MPTVELISLSGDSYHIEVPPLVPLFATADILARDLLQPAEKMIFFTLQGERVSKYIPVVEDLCLRVNLRRTDPCFIVVEQPVSREKYYYSIFDIDNMKPWNPDEVELEDSIVYAFTPIEEDDRFTIRSKNSTR